MRARSASVRSCTGLPFKRNDPFEGESSSPMMERSVDFPHPEGPAIDTYSPFRISRWMPDRAWVSTSSVKKTFVTPSSAIRGWAVSLIAGFLASCGTSSGRRSGRCAPPSVQPDALRSVLGRHVREDHPIAFAETLEGLDGAHRAASELDGDSLRAIPSRIEPEDSDGALLLAEGRAPHEEHVVEPLELDRPVHAEIRPGPLRQRSIERHVDGHGAVHDGGVDPDDVAGDESVARIDRDRLAHLHVAHLCLG